MLSKSSITLVIFMMLLISCKEPINDDISYFEAINDSIQKAYAPDKRVAIYDINLRVEANSIKIQGETDQEAAIVSLITVLEKKDKKIQNMVRMLPDSSVGAQPYALVNNSVANIRSTPKHSGELATQAILGTPLKVLKIAGDFYRVQTPDRYISWVDHGGVTLLSTDQYTQWNQAPKVIFTKSFGFVYKEPENELEKVSDIVLGAQLQLLEEQKDYYKVLYPDNREGFLKKSESQVYAKWLQELQPSGSLLELYAKELTGAPYLWGGTSSKGMDCSGFTKTVYLMNGKIIPRDASQQIRAGIDVDPQLQFSDLEKGDLMFFGKKATDSTSQRVTHVGIWLGNKKGEFIHASGKVKLGSIQPDSNNYDAFNKNRYLGSRRYLGQTDDDIINLQSKEASSKIKS